MSFRVLFRRAGPAANAASPFRAGSPRMPLKAKIFDAGAAPRLQMSTSTAHEIKELPGDEPEDVAFNSLYGLRSVELNRPRKYNALNASMIRKIIPRLAEWERSDMTNVVVMKGAGDRAFCAGGDVAALADLNKQGPEGQKKSSDYFALEYKLDHLIATYKKPYISFMDGITMGGGVGLSIHAPFRIATERTVFAMPETTIGFFPDVGASFFLPRMAGSLGTYLALTSERLHGANAFYSGVATHYLHSTSLPSLESRLAELRFRDFDSMEMRLKIIEMTIEEYATGLPPLDREPFLLAGERRKAIDRCFSKKTVPELIAALQAETGPTKDWAEKTLHTLHQRSPTAVHVALRQMQVGRSWNIAEAFQREHLIASQFMKHPDFVEGVTAQLGKEKRTPVWQPASLADVPPDGQISEPFFAAEGDKLSLLNRRTYTEYPYAYVGSPTEKEVAEFVRGGKRTRQAVLHEFLGRKRGRQGIQTIVEEVLDRKTERDEDDSLTWIEEDS